MEWPETAGADVQRDRIEVEVVAWGRCWESWSLDYLFLEGSPAFPKVWQKLDRLLGTTFTHEAGGESQIARLAIDTRGTFTAEVYEWCARHDPSRIIGVKGFDHINVPLGAPSYVDVAPNGRRLRRGAQLWPVGVSLLKSQLYGRLKLERPDAGEPCPDGYCHFPAYAEGLQRWSEDDWQLAETMAGQRCSKTKAMPDEHPLRAGGVIKSSWLGS